MRKPNNSAKILTEVQAVQFLNDSVKLNNSAKTWKANVQAARISNQHTAILQFPNSENSDRLGRGL